MSTTPWWRVPRLGILVAFLILVAFSLSIGGCGERGAEGEDEAPAAEPGEKPNARAMSGYEKDWWERKVPISILLTGGHLGHFQPCGCTSPKTGGLERLASILQMLRKRADAAGGTVRSLALGWSMRGAYEEQEQAAADYLRAAYAEIGFDGVLLGATDLVVPAMCQPRGPAGADRPRPPVNVVVAARHPAIETSALLDLQVGDLPLRALTMLDPDEAARLRGEGYVQMTMSATQALSGLRAEEEKVWVVGARPRNESTLNLIRSSLKAKGASIIVDVAGQDRGVDRVDRKPLSPGSDPLVVELSEFGTAVGVLDFEPNPDGKGWLVSYRRLDLVPQWSKYPGPGTRAIQGLEALYRDMVRSEGYLRDFPQTPDVGAAYVGSSACARCHPAIYNDWKKTPHPQALRTLGAIGYEWDPACVRCHVVGWERTSAGEWTARESAFHTPEDTGFLGGVGCESCHGPGSVHVADPWSKAPFGADGPNRARPGLRDTCIDCHDREQGVDFIRRYRREKLPAVDHHRVPADRRTVMPLTGGAKKGGKGR